MSKRRGKTIPLKPNHTWKAKPGNQIFVADRGAVRFEFPENWVVLPDPDSIKFYDCPPPDDNCRLAVSYLRIPNIDWSGLPLSNLIVLAVKDDFRRLWPAGEVVQPLREDIEVAWQEFGFLDPNEHREALTRIGFGRGFGIQALLTMDFWKEDRDRFHPVWQEALETLVLGKVIQDPTVGELYS
ncbi:MAG: hypothetical protein KY468_07770 [Armatimonadetes bacterium]|nr:hypothetical protein [Armatimonadota bacterium]